MAKEQAKAIKGKRSKRSDYLSKRTLVRAINKGTRNKSTEALRLQGYIVTVEDGWVIKVDKAGNKEKISKLRTQKRPTRIVLD